MMRSTSSVISNAFVVKGRIPAVGGGTSVAVLLRLLARRNHFHGDTTTCRTLDHSFLLRPLPRSSLSETIMSAFGFAVRGPGMAELGASSTALCRRDDLLVVAEPDKEHGNESLEKPWNNRWWCLPVSTTSAKENI
jgi:hypothetical protein